MSLAHTLAMNHLKHLSSLLRACLPLALVLPACGIGPEVETSALYAPDCKDDDGDGYGWSDSLRQTCDPNRTPQTENSDALYLTFDDGPSRDGVTEQILQTLNRYNAKATFFVTGSAADRNPQKIRSIIDAGHAIGLHSYSHQSYQNMTLSEMTTDLLNTRNAVDNAIDVDVTCYRPPFGATSSSIRNNAANAGYAEVMWDVDTSDWMATRTSELIQSDIDSSTNGDTVLMHDGETGKFNTANALEAWLSVNNDRFNFLPHPSCNTDATTTTPPATNNNELPPCSSASADPDGDGFGWENNASCKVVNTTPPTTTPTPAPTTSIPNSRNLPVCVSNSADPDGDGYGWENGESCIVDDAETPPSTPTPTPAPTTSVPNSRNLPACVSSSADPDGDGYGWENGESCIAS